MEFNQKLVALRGQNKGPDDVAPSDMDIKGKSGFGRIEVEIYNALFFADTVTAATGKAVVAMPGESGTVSATPFTVTVSHAATFLNDLGVFDPATGFQLQQVPSAPVAGQSYTVVETGGGKGVYTFAAGDTLKTYLFEYVYSTTTGVQLLVNNHIQGYGPIFELYLLQNYQDPGNCLHLFACRASKMSAPMKRDGYMISDFEFESYPNAGGQWFEWLQVSV